MGPAERRRRQREMKAEAINEIVMTTMIRELESTKNGNARCEVDSFTVVEQLYVIIVQNGSMHSCNCADFMLNKIACKHMYLLDHLHRSIIIYEESAYVLDLAPYTISTQVNNEEAKIRNNASFDDIMDKLASILATCCVSRPANVSEAEFNELSNHVDSIAYIVKMTAASCY
ncbi:hypothetical protein [Parasitella parasitica]|uniref:SWIM-type domain-containing protein n=1 Tax=Parasitella parasitica TaxID=35722 RepID=A0A0B7MUH7_9FUNG|nr:hypothetical protein [Parasitella parasitica]